MTRSISDREVAAVRKLAPDVRYEYSVKRMADRGEVWSLRSAAGWVVGEDVDGVQQHPVWPHPAFAEQAATGSWSDAQPAAIDVHEWLDRWTPGLQRDGRRVSVFPVDGDANVSVTPSEFEAALRAELAKVE